MMVSSVKDTVPENDRFFMMYCDDVRSCADKRARNGVDHCGNCPVTKECEAFFDKVSEISVGIL